jgi:hypothetical protein
MNFLRGRLLPNVLRGSYIHAMEPFARIVIGYHGCTESYARDLLLGTKPLREWQPSTNDWDWLGHGIYFWEHSPERALRWAEEKFVGNGDKPAVLGAVIQLGRCFDLLPLNKGRDWKLRELDCLVINDCLTRLEQQGVRYDTVRGAFLEGEPAYARAGFSREAHVQIAARNLACIQGVFRPNW